MLIVNYVIDTLPIIEKTEKLKTSMTFSVEISIEKNGRRENNFQNKCVSSQNRRNKKRRGRHRSGYTYLPSGETVLAGLVRAERAAILHGDIQLYRKAP
jgi:hypothetical protein